MRRGQKNFKAEDLVFILRHDKDKVNRLRTYLSWKDVRKHAKETDAPGADDVDIGDDNQPGKCTLECNEQQIYLFLQMKGLLNR
jgi:transcription initiation protein SPT3